MLYKHRNNEEAEEFLNKILTTLHIPKNKTIVDVGCGMGRHSINLNALGYKVSGFDISPLHIQKANYFANENLHFFVHDMRNALAEKFDVAINVFTSFGYFDDPNDNEKVMQNIYDCLCENGFFIFDFLNEKYVRSHLVSKDIKEIDGIVFTQERNIQDNVVIKKIEVKDKFQTLYFTEQVNLLTRNELTKMLNKTGFDIQYIFGDYKLNKFDENSSPRLIFIAKK